MNRADNTNWLRLLTETASADKSQSEETGEIFLECLHKILDFEMDESEYQRKALRHNYSL